MKESHPDNLLNNYEIELLATLLMKDWERHQDLMGKMKHNTQFMLKKLTAMCVQVQ
jgi:hypothetical protein